MRKPLFELARALAGSAPATLALAVSALITTGCRQTATGDSALSETAARSSSAEAASQFPAEPKWDLVIAIDTSNSSNEPSGADIDGDGRVGKNPRPGSGPLGRWLSGADQDDSVLGAELQAVRALLSQLERIPIRVGIVAYAGGNPHLWPDARVEVPLTRDRTRLEEGLRAVLEHATFDQTNVSAAIDTAAQALIAPAQDAPSARTARLLLLLSDGQPTAPERMPRDNISRALVSAEQARAAGIRIIPVDFSPEGYDSSFMAALARLDGREPVRAPPTRLVERLADPTFLTELLR